LFALAVRYIRKKSKKGECVGCSGGCESCSGCHPHDDKKLP
jgi:hypothetical protein